MGRNKKGISLLEYNKKELCDIINSIKIDVSKEYNKLLPSGKNVKYRTISTFYNDSLIKEAEVSGRYELFDFPKFALEVIEKIEKMYSISKYSYHINGGIQEFRLHSDSVSIDGRTFIKTFNILNSTDRTRNVDVYYGLYCEKSDYHFISKSALSKRHYVGISECVDKTFKIEESIVFDDQIKILENMSYNNILFSHLRNVILGRNIIKYGDIQNVEFGEIESKSNHTKFDVYKKKLLDLYDSDKYNKSSNCQVNRSILAKSSVDMENMDISKFDISFNCLDAFEKYITIYSTRDSAIIKKESEIFLNATDLYIRNEKLRYILEMM